MYQILQGAQRKEREGETFALFPTSYFDFFLGTFLPFTMLKANSPFLTETETVLPSTAL